MSGLLVSPTEPQVIKDIGRSSSVPEQYGVDVMWPTSTIGTVGVQRKEFNDLIASMTDGRLSKEVAQMQGLKLKLLVVEGRGTWTRDGKLMHQYKTMEVTEDQVRGFLYSVRLEGVWVEWTEDVYETIRTIRRFKAWTEKEQHKSLKGRPGPKGSWGQVTSRDYAIHVLTSLPGIGPTTAENIIDHFGGVPMEWSVDADELQDVDGVGKVRAKRMLEALS